MVPASRSLSRARRPAPRRVPPRHPRTTTLKAIAVGLAALAIVLTATAAAVIGTGRMLAVASESGPRVRPDIAAAPPATDRWSVAFAPRLPPRAVVLAELTPPPAIALASAAPPLDEPSPMEAMAAFAPPDMPASGPDITGALGPAPAKDSVRPAVQVASAGPVALPPREALPVPRARPQLAALPPTGAPGQPDEATHPARTAIYDITAAMVYLPNGEKLEAHSGLGPMMDDPRHSKVRMRGPTPPNIYKLTEREALFHGVRAIRMTPLDESAMHGRDGILAHTYMLGPNGQSNGCVSFKDYPRFLRAFLRGEVDRMIVVARMDKLPVVASRPVKTAEVTW